MKYFYIILATAVIVGGGVYYFVSSSNTKDRNNLLSKIDNLQSQITSVKTPTATPSTTPGSLTPTTNPTPTPTPASGAFSVSNLNSATVVISGSNYRLTDGVYTHPGTGPFTLEVPSIITLNQNHTAIDVTNPNQAAIILAIGGMRHGGATVNFNELEIIINQAGKPKYLARTLLNGYQQSTINNVTFASDTVTVNLTPVDGTSQTNFYKLINGELVQK